MMRNNLSVLKLETISFLSCPITFNKDTLKMLYNKLIKIVENLICIRNEIFSANESGFGTAHDPVKL